VSIWVGLIIAFPFVFYEIWKFIKPGLYQKEQKAAKGIVFVCSILFIFGVLFGYFIIAPFAVSFLASYSVGADVISKPTLSSYVNYLTMFTIPTGIVFELPVFVYFFSKLGLVTPAGMKKYRKHAFIVILIIAAVITPPDVMTQFLIGIPIFILYEISIFISARVEKKAKEEEDA
jgi:sec-independent protein translocase protein TatC